MAFHRLLFGLPLAVLGAVAQPADDPPPRPPLPAPPAEVLLRVRAGRAALVQGDGIQRLTRAAGTRAVLGEAYLELGAGGEIELRWPGLSSLRVRGPAALEWNLAAEAANDPVLHVLRFLTLEAEVRRGSQELNLPQGWTLRLERGALHVAASPNGLRVENRGGKDVTVTSRVEREGETRLRIKSGERKTLPAP